MANLIEMIKNSYPNFSNLQDTVIENSVDSAKAVLELDGIKNDSTIYSIALKHYSNYLLLLRYGSLKSTSEKEHSESRFDTDPCSEELKIYNSLRDKYLKSVEDLDDSFLIRG